MKAGEVSILVVEDEDVIAEDIQETLQHFGYVFAGRVAAAESVLDLAQEEQPDLVLMDINLEGDMDGISAAAQVRDTLNIPVVFLTSLGDDETLRRASITDPYGYVLKPFKDIELRAAIELALHRFYGDTQASEESEVNNDARAVEEDVSASEDSDPALASRVAEVLKRVPPFDLIEKHKLSEAASGAHFETYQANEPIVFEGDECTSGILVVEGRVAVVKSSVNGKELVVELLPPGDPFGLLPTLDKQPYAVTLKAQIDTVVLFIPRRQVMRLLDEHPEVSKQLISRVFDRLRSAHDLSRALAHDLVEVRVASALVALLPKFCTMEQEDGEIAHVIHMTRQELAEMIGSTSETVIRVTKNMERDGLLDLSTSSVIRILNADKLAAIAEHD